VFLLNNDVEVDADVLGPLVAEANRRANPGAVCSKILFADPPDLIWFAGASFDPKAGYNGRQRGYRERDDGRFDEAVETDRACGAAMLISRAALEEVGMLDDDLFCYFEDTDWSLRAGALGGRHAVVPASRVWHKVSASSGGESSATALYYDLRNAIVVCERHAPLGIGGTFRRRFMLTAAHAVQALRSGQRRAGLRAVVDGLRDARRGKLGQRRPS